jgi:hypothetical protein
MTVSTLWSNSASWSFTPSAGGAYSTTVTPLTFPALTPVSSGGFSAMLVIAWAARASVASLAGTIGVAVTPQVFVPAPYSAWEGFESGLGQASAVATLDAQGNWIAVGGRATRWGAADAGEKAALLAAGGSIRLQLNGSTLASPHIEGAQGVLTAAWIDSDVSYDPSGGPPFPNNFGDTQATGAVTLSMLHSTGSRVATDFWCGGSLGWANSAPGSPPTISSSDGGWSSIVGVVSSNAFANLYVYNPPASPAWQESATMPAGADDLWYAEFALTAPAQSPRVYASIIG